MAIPKARQLPTFLYDPYSSTPYTTIDAPGSVQGTFANGINAAGQIVGSYNDASGIPHGFLRTTGPIFTAYTPINDPFAIFTVAEGINASGQVVGYYGGHERLPRLSLQRR